MFGRVLCFGTLSETVGAPGKYVLVANYVAGSVAMFPILPNGSLGKASVVLPHTGHSVNPERQKEPHAHSIYVSPDNRFVVSADLGTDEERRLTRTVHASVG